MTDSSPRALLPASGCVEEEHRRHGGARLRAARAALTPPEWRRFGVMIAAVVAINALGWGIFLLAVQPHHFHYQGLGVGLGVGVGVGVGVGTGVGVGAGRTSMAAMFHWSVVGAVSEIVTVDPAAWSLARDWLQKVSPDEDARNW